MYRKSGRSFEVHAEKGVSTALQPVRLLFVEPLVNLLDYFLGYEDRSPRDVTTQPELRRQLWCVRWLPSELAGPIMDECMSPAHETPKIREVFAVLR